MPLVTLTEVDKFFGADQILDGVSFRVERGDRAALIGVNGAGKSTILQLIAGLEEPDGGSISRARNLRIAYLPQEPDFREGATLYDSMLDAFQEAIEAQQQLRILEREMAVGESDPEMVERYGQLQALVEHTGYDYREQIERVLTGLELEHELWTMPVETLSGGQRTRANLARTLLQDADLLLLDEPTNHLDIRAVEWLESYLLDLKRAFLIVAHDRYLLDRVTRRTLELSFGTVTAYDVPYSRYLDLRAERMERHREEYEAQQEHIEKTEEFIRRFGAGQRSKEARGRQKRLNRLERIDRPREEEGIHLRLDGPKRSGDLVLELERLVVGYGDDPLVRLPRQVVVRRGERVAVVGPNGSGKTTLLRTLVGGLPPLAGSVRWGANASVGYYSQTLGHLDDRLTVIEEVQRVKPMGEEEARSFLGRFLFSGDDVFKRVSILSGGERSRVALAKLILDAPNVLVLDEPTNHLDIASRQALQDVLAAFAGTILFVSHDRYLIDSLAGELWVVGDGRLVRYDGTYSALTAGKARPLDREAERVPRKELEKLSPEERLDRLQAEAEGLAGRLAEVGPGANLGQLAEMIDEYGEVQDALLETNILWLRTVHEAIPSSSA